MMDTEEWRDAVHHSTDLELELAADSHRAALGITGDREDARW